MLEANGGAGVVPVMDLNNNHNNYGDGFGYGGCMWFVWIIVLFALMGGWGNWGNRNNNNGFLDGTLTRQDIQNGFDNQDIQNGIRGIQNGMCDGFYAQNTTMLNGFNGVGREVMENRFQLGEAIANNRFAAQQCCCETKQAIESVRAENYRNTAVSKMKNVDGTIGEHWSMEQTNTIATQHGIDHKADFYYTINMLYSDFSKVLGSDSSTYVKLAKAYMLDPDADEGKVFNLWMGQMRA